MHAQSDLTEELWVRKIVKLKRGWLNEAITLMAELSGDQEEHCVAVWSMPNHIYLLPTHWLHLKSYSSPLCMRKTACVKKKQFNSINKTVGENVYDMYDRMTHLKDIFTIPRGHRRRFVNDSEATQLTLAGQWQYAVCRIFWLLSYYTPIHTIHFFNCWEVIKRCTYS